jgi:Zn-dependent protease
VVRDVLSWSFPIGQLFGIMIRVHFTMPLLMIGLIGREWGRKDTIPNSWHDAAMLMGLMFLSVLIHEFGHCFAARFMDGESDEILLWPLGGLAFCKSLPNTWRAHFVFSAGGPLMDLAKCIVIGLILVFAFDVLPPLNPFWYPYRLNESGAIALPSWDGTKMTDSLPVIILARFFWISWVLMLFNLILVGYPFDSGRMLQAALWPRLGHYQATYVAIYCGFGVMAIVGVCAIWFVEPLLAFLTVFIYVACAQEMQMLESTHEDSMFGDFSQGYTSLEKDEPAQPKVKKQNFIQRWLAQRAAKKLQQEQEQREADDRRMDELLEKIQKFGKTSLTDEEQRFLKRVADRYKNKP